MFSFVINPALQDIHEVPVAKMAGQNFYRHSGKSYRKETCTKSLPSLIRAASALAIKDPTSWFILKEPSTVKSAQGILVKYLTAIYSATNLWNASLPLRTFGTNLKIKEKI
jgi:hypothetical protein